MTGSWSVSSGDRCRVVTCGWELQKLFLGALRETNFVAIAVWLCSCDEISLSHSLLGPSRAYISQISTQIEFKKVCFYVAWRECHKHCLSPPRDVIQNSSKHHSKSNSLGFGKQIEFFPHAIDKFPHPAFTLGRRACRKSEWKFINEV